ncbi:MAG: DUF169 domain-containing protein [Leptospiraceae bacterium]|nr:DUF169 domain-containing protein [Leptospiraceae bacterium]MCP5494731.1 DUF169 domain-containing protein [Leptospiraceae bacterium]
MGEFNQLYNQLLSAFEVKEITIPTSGVKFFKKGDTVPEEVLENASSEVTLTSCQATRSASLEDAVYLTIHNIGCIAAAISLGLVDQNQKEPLEGPRVYTNIMKEQSILDKHKFKPPSPHEFTEGIVYSCQNSGHSEYALFGKEDVGRFRSVEIAKNAVSDMIAIQPAIMQGVFFFSPTLENINLVPDVVILSVRPVELARLVQAYSWYTGKRINSSMGAVRVVNSDLIVRPYLTNEINVSTYCVGARLIAQYEADRLGIAFPYNLFKDIVEYMELSRKGYPFPNYPGATS